MRTCQKMFLMLLLLGSPVFAAQPREFKFTKILEFGGPVDASSNGTLNDRGTVAVTVTIDGIGYAVLVGDGRTLSKVAETAVGTLGPAVINNRGDVVFRASSREGHRLLLSRNGRISTLFGEEEPFVVVGDPLINARGTLAFGVLRATGDRSLLTLDHGEAATLATHQRAILPYDINQRGQVLFLTNPDRPSLETLTVSDGRTTWIPADASGAFEYFTGAAINDGGTVGFSVYLVGGDERIYLANPQGGLRPIVTTDGPFNVLWLVGLTNSGTPVFTASLNAGELGVFVGPDPVADKVISTGDTLDGAIVKHASASDVNASGQILVRVSLDNGTTALYRTQPGSVR